MVQVFLHDDTNLIRKIFLTVSLTLGEVIEKVSWSKRKERELARVQREKDEKMRREIEEKEKRKKEQERRRRRREDDDDNEEDEGDEEEAGPQSSTTRRRAAEVGERESDEESEKFKGEGVEEGERESPRRERSLAKARKISRRNPPIQSSSFLSSYFWIRITLLAFFVVGIGLFYGKDAKKWGF